MYFSNPQNENISCKAFKLDILSVCAAGCKVDYITDFFKNRQIPCAENGNLAICAQQDDSRSLTYIEESRSLSDEKYVLTTEFKDGRLYAHITFGAERGLYYALCDLYRSILDGEFRLGTVTEYPLFSVRGYIEGFYGTPWKQEQRLEMLEWLSAYRMNTYFYAPKDDPYHRERWSELYPSESLAHLQCVVDKAKECHVDFWFCIAPGLDICYSDEKQFAELVAKCAQLYAIGVHRFGLLLDDIPQELHFDCDRALYGETVQAHISLVNRLFDALTNLGAGIQLTVCPMQYHGKGNEYYISKLGQGIDGRISMFWTGNNICSQELTVPEAVRFADHTRHKPLYWDNYPVNDAEMCHEMHLGWYTGREPELYRYAQGVIVNCMPYCLCNRIPLLTVADYLWNPVQYSEEQSWQYAMSQVVGEDAETFAFFAEHLTVSCLKSEVSPRMVDALSQFDTLRRTQGVKVATLHLETYLRSVQSCCDRLNFCKGDELYIELAPWIEKFFVFKDILAQCCAYLHSGDLTCKVTISEKLRQFMRLPEVMTDFAFQAAVEAILNIEVL